jgi:hypothetical protein
MAMQGAANGMLDAWMQPYGAQSQLASQLPGAAEGLAGIYGMGANYMQQGAALDLQRQTGNIERQYQDHVRSTTRDVLPYAMQYATSFPPQMPIMETGQNPLWGALGQIGSSAMGNMDWASMFGLGRGGGGGSMAGTGWGGGGATGATYGGLPMTNAMPMAGGYGGIAGGAGAAAGFGGMTAPIWGGAPAMGALAPTVGLGAAPGAGAAGAGMGMGGIGAGLGTAAAWAGPAAFPFIMGRLVNGGQHTQPNQTPEQMQAEMEAYFGPNWAQILGGGYSYT